MAYTYYVSPDGSGALCSIDIPCSLAGGVDKLVGGDTLILKDGNYANGTINSVPSGTLSAFTIIEAANDGGAVLTADGAMNLVSKSYIQIEGIKFKYNGEKNISGPSDGSAPSHHIKILRCAFEGGTQQVINSHNFYFAYSHHLLIEDSWFYGLGGRYTLCVQSSSEVVLRRVVVRKDGGWPGESNGDPEAAVSIYNSSNSLVQNLIVIDSQAAYSSDWYASLFLVENNSTSSHPNDNVTFEGTIILNGLDRGILTNAGVSNATFNNVIVANIKKGPASLARSIHAKDSSNINFSHLTLLDNPSYETSNQYGVYYDGTDGKVANAIIYGLTGTGTTACIGVICSGYGLTNNPYTDGLKYLVKKEQNSILNINDYGATVMTKLGTDGSFYGDAGYNVDNGNNLWPWPNEDRIKKDFSSVSARGFATGTSMDGSPQTLTKYIWETLDNSLPNNIYFFRYSINDFSNLFSNWLKVGTISDLNSDNTVNTGDLGIMMSKWK